MYTWSSQTKFTISDELQEDIVAGGGQFITYPEVSPEFARTHVSTHIRNLSDKGMYLQVVSRLIDSNGKTVSENKTQSKLNQKSATTVEQDLPLAHPALWHPYSPNLYTLQTQLISQGKILDERQQQIGIRHIRYTAKEGFSSTGKNFIYEEPTGTRLIPT